MQSFKKYNSIENSYRSEFIDRIRNSFIQDVFIVQEKVHGANLSFWTDGVEIKTAKRSAFLEEDEKFYNFQLVREHYRKAILSSFQILKTKYPTISHISIYGELIGGSYSHPDVERVKNTIRVQKGIAYTPKNDFYAFDIRINSENYLAIEEANAIFEQTGLFYAKTLFKGSLEDALKYPNNFESKISGWLGFPSIENNICEGTVIKPNKSHFFKSGTRAIIKNKNEQWSENKNHKIKIKKEEVLSEMVIKLKDIIETYITENRLNNVVSKVGEISFKDFGRVLGLFNKDILEDFSKDYNSHYDELEKSEQKKVKKHMGEKAAVMLRNYLKRI